MDDETVERFLQDGFVKIEGAFPPRVAEHCARLLWRETGYAAEDPATWKDPVVWVADMAQGPFAAAVNSPVLHEAFDTLAGKDRWQSRYSLGSFPSASRTRRNRTTRAGTSRRATSPKAPSFPTPTCARVTAPC